MTNNPLMFRRVTILFCFAVVVIACVPPSSREDSVVDTDILQPEIRRVLDFRNSEEIDSLLALFDSPLSSVRYSAAESFTSLQSNESIDPLINLLSDKSNDVRVMAASALGQQGDPAAVQHLVEAFKGRDTVSIDNRFNGAILESIAKCDDGTQYLKFLATQNTYQTTDTILLTSQAKAIYRYGLRKKVLQEGTNKMIDLVLNESVPDQARLYAAHYLARVKGLDIKKFQFRIANQFVKEQNVDIKMALALALKQADPSDDIRQLLYDGLQLQNDDRVKINILRTLPKFVLNDTILTSLELTASPLVKEAIADFYGSYHDNTIAPLIRQKAKTAKDTLYKAQLYQAYLKMLPYYYGKSRNAARYEIQLCLDEELSDQEHSTFISALGYDMLSYDLLGKMYDTIVGEPIKTAIASSVSRILTSNDFEKVFATSPRYARLKMLEIVKKIVEDADVGALYEISPALGDPKLGRLMDSTTFIQNAIDQLVLPRDVETYEVLHSVIDRLNDTTTVSRYIPSHLPIRWDLLESINPKTEFVVKTGKGLFSIRPYLSRAPESVANFTRLVEEDFYDGKIFHRVVPNFVAQTGCTRGDGYGSINSTIHSEVGHSNYDEEGYVGMASAGPHTESAQWFITHSPTPHLDGRYTIFGKVIKGMDTVHKLVEGDIIQDIIKVD